MSRAARSRVDQEFSIQHVAQNTWHYLKKFWKTGGSSSDIMPCPPPPDIGPRTETNDVLKVLQLIPTLDRSGAEKQMVMLAKGLPRDRFRVEVATLTRMGPLEAELAAAGIPVTAIGKRLKFDPLALARLTQFLRNREI